MKITVFQALTILAQKYRNDESNTETYYKIKSLYLSGVRSPKDAETLDQLLQDDTLSNYEITDDRAAINDDPVRRYFESQLSHETLSDSLDSLDSRRLKRHFESMFIRLGESTKQYLLQYVYGVTKRSIENLSGTQKEYGEGILALKDPTSFQSLKPETGKGKKSPEEILQERKDKMTLLAQCSQVAMSVVNNKKNNSRYPLNLYSKKDYVFDPPNRGRVARKDTVTGHVQTVRSNTLGIMRSYMPLRRDDELHSETPARYGRPADNSTYMDDGKEHLIPDRTFATKVAPFVNSISGTMLIQVRAMAQLFRDKKYVYEAKGKDANEIEEQLRNYFKSFISYMTFYYGGHSLNEFISVLELPEVQDEFKNLPGFNSLTLEQLFKIENDDAFERAVEKTIDYNTAILQRKELHEELLEPNLVRELKEGEDELTVRARSRLKSFQNRLGKATSLDRRNKVIDEAYIQYITPRNEDTESQEEANDRVKKAEGVLVEKFNIKLDHITDKQARSYQAFTHIMSKMTERQEQLRQDLYNGSGTLAHRLDHAWEIYKDDNRTEDDRLIAQNYMIFVLDLKDQDILESLNETLERLMLERELRKNDNPDFIPGKSPIVLSEKIKSDLKQTEKTGVTHIEEVDKLIQKKDILDVNPNSKLKDKGQLKLKHGRVNLQKTEFFNPEERDMLRAVIRQGAFYNAGGEVLDTQKSISHGKEGFAAFTLNVNGELSIFQHIDHDKTGIAHSSMNAGVPVVSAGEIEIKNGKLISITEHSGHYRPSLYSMYKTLDYFRKQGVDISDVKVLTFSSSKIIERHLKIDVSQSKQFGRFREINAGDLCNSYLARLKLIVQSAKMDLEAYQSSSFMKFLYKLKDYITGSTLTKDREEIAKKLSEGLVDLSQEINSANTLESMKAVNEKINKLIDTAYQENVTLNSKHGKEKSHGNFAQRINFFRQQLGEMSGRVESAIKVIEQGSGQSEEEILSSSDKLKGMGRK
ncbi:hypothetical protein ELY21_08180 [Legionella sp. km535]|uniref:hypothetical protein n=1 Tax=Legionella sp. km535 TaxID=2498107 RepID=UPI000F8E5446|nr:hypothetical protein [Legionella sp. km535]RUR18427.1 hypothetical protein ELY21_08180 [Legionella sp. km535]